MLDAKFQASLYLIKFALVLPPPARNGTPWYANPWLPSTSCAVALGCAFAGHPSLALLRRPLHPLCEQPF